ncbi:MAG: Holliday junction branch migration protein RuvA, partial [Actinomycetota bacterium]|nr:Holliday junction branch migration protein RuvA [Actinomycetota bacterium]
LDLRGKLVADADGADVVPARALAETAGPRDEVRAALAALGYDAGEVAAALRALPDDTDASVEVLLRDALRAVSVTPR